MQPLSTVAFKKYFTYDPEKRYFLCGCDSWNLVARDIQPSSKHFGLLLVTGAKTAADSTLIQAAKDIQNKGLAYLCAWGGDCKRVEDIFDGVYVERELDGEISAGRNDTLMTTSHADEPLSEAMWYFGRCAWPTKYFARDCKDWIVAVVASKESEAYVRDNMAQILSRDEG